MTSEYLPNVVAPKLAGKALLSSLYFLLKHLSTYISYPRVPAAKFYLSRHTLTAQPTCCVFAKTIFVVSKGEKIGTIPQKEVVRDLSFFLSFFLSPLFPRIRRQK